MQLEIFSQKFNSKRFHLDLVNQDINIGYYKIVTPSILEEKMVEKIQKRSF
ncbi:MAG: hypothetical protein NWF10_07280 [Candidatus Bathyarchaeota archaeon]|nr:hypothetical protein [Candidatus Bathyarchaeota archaeon]